MNFLRFSGALALVVGALLLTSCATEPFAKVPFDVSLGAPVTFSVPEGPSDIYAADFNGDGFEDLVSFHFFRSGVVFLEGDGTGGFTNHGLLAMNPRPALGKLLDYNLDGLPDLLVLLHDSREAVLLAGDETDGIRVEWAASLAHASSASSASIGEQTSPEHGGIGESGKISYLDVGDIDGDGELDLLVSYETGNFEIWHGDGAGNFEVGDAFGTEVQFPRAVILDADDDGLGDVVVFGNTLNFGDDLESGKKSSKGYVRFAKLPDLIIIDGGKGQLSATLAVLKKLDMADLSIGALAKKKEEVFLPGQSRPVWLPRDSEALFLLQHIRDEAHRFGITYHRSLRQRRTVHSALDDIPGVGPKRRATLM